VALCVGDGGWEGLSKNLAMGLVLVLRGTEADGGDVEPMGECRGKYSRVVVLGEEAAEDVVE
jgi:hypothetical protein